MKKKIFLTSYINYFNLKSLLNESINDIVDKNRLLLTFVILCSCFCFLEVYSNTSQEIIWVVASWQEII